MILSYFGEGGFRLQSGDVSLLVDPPNNRLKADVVLRTLVPVGIASEQASEIVFPGEYEVEGIQISGWQLKDESTEKFIKTVYLVRWEEMRFAFLGQAKDLPPTEILDNLDGELDFLFLPIGGGETLSSKDAAGLVKQLEPLVAVPGFYKKADDFLKLLGQSRETQEKFVFKKKDLAGKKSEVLIFKNLSA